MKKILNLVAASAVALSLATPVLAQGYSDRDTNKDGIDMPDLRNAPNTTGDLKRWLEDSKRRIDDQKKDLKQKYEQQKEELDAQYSGNEYEAKAKQAEAKYKEDAKELDRKKDQLEEQFKQKERELRDRD